jgi:hypothetical protein
MNTRLLYLLILLVLIVAIPANAQSPSKSIYRYEPHKVQLTGKLSLKMFYGPPGYGETPKQDTKEHVFVITLRKAITVIADSADSVNETTSNVKNIQIFNPDNIPLYSLRGNVVTVSGVLHTSLDGHEHTAVILDLETIDPIK